MQDNHIKKCTDFTDTVDISNDNDHISLRVYMTIVGMAQQTSVQEDVIGSLLEELERATERQASCGLFTKGDIKNILQEMRALTGTLRTYVQSLT